MKLDIIQIGNPALRVTAEEIPVKEVCTENIQKFINNLIETMYAANGAGLAATQVASPLKIFVAEVDNNPRYPYIPKIPLTVVINPKITFLTKDCFKNFEGCLSVPNLRGIVQRCPEIRLEGLDREGNCIDQVIRGVTAGTFQHENDHLDGLLFTDKLIDTKSLCTWDEFSKHYEDDFRHQVEQIVAKYGS